jgi:hypothetical protein
VAMPLPPQMPTGRGERFFPVAPSHPTPVPTDRVLVAVEDLASVLDRFSPKAVQGTVVRSGEVLLLAFDPRCADQPR